MIQITGLTELILPVQNMEMMVRFYRDTLGLTVQFPQNIVSYAHEHRVTFLAGACLLTLETGGQGRLGEDFPKMVFGVHDIQRARSYLVQRDVEMGDIQINKPAALVCNGRDPEGNLFALEYQELITDIPSQHIL